MPTLAFEHDLTTSCALPKLNLASQTRIQSRKMAH